MNGNFDSGYISIMDMVEICGLNRTIETGRQSVSDYHAAISKGILKQTVEHDDFFNGVSKALDKISA